MSIAKMEQPTNNISSVLSRATDEQRGVEVPPCLAQQFPAPSAIDRQMSETAKRCDEHAKEEEAGSAMGCNDADGHG